MSTRTDGSEFEMEEQKSDFRLEHDGNGLVTATENGKVLKQRKFDSPDEAESFMIQAGLGVFG